VKLQQKFNEFAKRNQLTPQQRNVLFYMLQGGCVKKVASKMGLSPNTVKSHLNIAYLKLNVHSALEACSAFYEETE
jgi:DNA-binding NarL/FixJ family response regulator